MPWAIEHLNGSHLFIKDSYAANRLLLSQICPTVRFSELIEFV